MRTKFIKRTMIVIAFIACVLSGAIGCITATLKPFAEEATANVQTLNGFECAGASVRVDKVGTRFEFNLSGEALSKKGCTAGVVYMPYDLYKGDLNAFVKGQDKSLTAEFDWENNAASEDTTDLVGYTYLNAEVIPENMYNRMLVVRGYIQDGDTVYYTETIKTSMAYSAWQGTLGSALTDEQKQSLKAYMGPYTLTYGTGENDKIENLYYGDQFSNQLPATMGDYDVEGWYWDEAYTNAITDADYATGTMPVYYKWQEFTVSGTVSCAESVDLTTVRIAVDGVETDATVAANGAYSVSVQPGTHKFTFSCDGYKAYALNIAVSEDLTLDNAELKSDLYEIGKFGNVENTPNLVPEDDFDGTYTVTGNPYLLTMPNTATTGAFTYTVKVSDVTADRYDKAFAASVSNGAWALSIGLYQWETIVVNLSSAAGAAFIGYYDLSGVQQYIDGATIKIVRTESAIEVYVLDRLYFTFTSAGITPADGVTDRNWGNSFVTNQDKLAGFFGENVRLACGIAALNGDAFTATYNCKIEKYFAVSGTVSAPAEVTVANTTLKVDGIDTPISVNADGTYTASVPEGTHTLTFGNGAWSATQEVTVVNGANTVDVTLKDYTWLAGNYGSVNSTNTPELNENGVYTISGTNQLVLFPNTATTGAFTYTVKVSDVTADRYDKAFAASVSNGAWALSIGLYQWETIVVNLSSAAGATFIGYYDLSGVQQYIDGATIKIVRTESAIEVYVLDRLYFTFTSAGITPAEGVTDRGWGNSFVTNQDKLAGFFGENVRLACGIATLNGSFTATYQCNITNN